MNAKKIISIYNSGKNLKINPTKIDNNLFNKIVSIYKNNYTIDNNGIVIFIKKNNKK